MTRPRKNISEKEHGNERRYLNKVFTKFKKLHFAKKPTRTPEVVVKKDEWVAYKSQNIQAVYQPNQLKAILKLSHPGMEVENRINLKKVLFRLVHSMNTVPQVSILAGCLLIIKERNTDKALIKISELTQAQLKLLHYSPQLLQNPHRLEASLGLSEEQTVVFEEEQILMNMP